MKHKRLLALGILTAIVAASLAWAPSLDGHKEPALPSPAIVPGTSESSPSEATATPPLAPAPAVDPASSSPPTPSASARLVGPAVSWASHLPELQQAADGGDPAAICELAHTLHGCHALKKYGPHLKDRWEGFEVPPYLDHACKGFPEVKASERYRRLTQAADLGNAAAAAELVLRGPGEGWGFVDFEGSAENPVIILHRAEWAEHERHRERWLQQAIRAGDLRVVASEHRQAAGFVMTPAIAHLDPHRGLIYARVLHRALDKDFEDYETLLEDLEPWLSALEMEQLIQEGDDLYENHFSKKTYSRAHRGTMPMLFPPAACPGWTQP